MSDVNYDLDIQKRFDSIIDKIKEYNPKADLPLIEKAFLTANKAHDGVARKSGEPYILHPIGVVETLVGLKLDDASICAGFLHDVVEDVEGWTIDRVKEEFSEEIANLVDGLTKLNDQEFETDNVDGRIDPLFSVDKRKSYFIKNATNLRKIFLAMSMDMRVMVIKLADRLHNMRTLDGLSRDKQVRMAIETIQIFAPVAHRLGIYSIKTELEDLCFKYLYPEEFEEVKNNTLKVINNRKNILDNCVTQLDEVLKENNIQATIQHRIKSYWSIRNKMIKKKCSFDEISDLFALRVIVNTTEECYNVLGLVHILWMPISGEFKDYISVSKPNGYASLHTRVLSDGDPLEIQIRTYDMHSTAEYGVAAHWAYKERSTSGDYFERKMSMLRKRLFQWQQGNDTAEEYFNALVNELFCEQVYIFTPRGDAIDLKVGATVIDFAYRIHTDVGNHCVGAKVNGIMVPINHILKNQDIVEVITRPNANPSMDWLKFVKTDQAKTKIKQYFKKSNADEYETMGKAFIEKIIGEQGLDKSVILTSKNLAEFIDNNNIKSEKELFIAIGFGILSPVSVVNKIKKNINYDPKETKKSKASVASRVVREEASLETALNGVDNMLFTRGKCCEPLPGEEVVGYITRGKGITLHSVHCTNVATIKQKNPERLYSFNWSLVNDEFPTSLRIKVNGEVGSINEITTITATEKVLIEKINSYLDKDKYVVIDLVIAVKNIEQLDNIISKLKSIQNVVEIYRPVSRIREKD